MLIQDMISAYHLSSDVEERISKNMLKNLKGSVRINLGSVITPMMMIVILGVIEFWLFHMIDGIMAMFTLIVYLIGSFLMLWELFSYRIDFDGSTGFIQYHTLFRGTTTYHINELMNFDIHSNHSYSYFHRRRYHSTLRTRELLEIHTTDGTITVPISSAWLTSKPIRGVGGYRDADKFYTYLEIYHRYVHKSSFLTEAAQYHDLAPSVQASIKAEQRQAAFAPVPEQQSIPELADEDCKPASVSAEKLTMPAPPTPDISVSVAGEPEAHMMPPLSKATHCFPDPAQHPTHPEPSAKPPADVDQLFEEVLRRHGKRP